MNLYGKDFLKLLDYSTSEIRQLLDLAINFKTLKQKEIMKITGKVHCFFEQSGTFKNEFIKLGIPAEDHDIQNNFGETDHVIDLFAEIEKGYNREPSIFDNITPDDLIMAFFPCIYFETIQMCYYQLTHLNNATRSKRPYLRQRIADKLAFAVKNVL